LPSCGNLLHQSISNQDESRQRHLLEVPRFQVRLADSELSC